MHKLIISAPFGNYLEWDGYTSTIGTYTYDYRGGPLYRLWRVARTLRYYPGIGAWKNKLGLPNPGIHWLVSNQLYVKGIARKIVSISGDTGKDRKGYWEWLLYNIGLLIIKPLAVELNVSCPNIDGKETDFDYTPVFTLAKEVQTRYNTEIIVKLPPVHWEGLVSTALDCGLDSFHCCNTLPIPAGGLSGKPLMMFSLDLIRAIRGKASRIIGGGGVTCASDVKKYLDAGATNVAIGSALFNPFRWKTLKSFGVQNGTERTTVST